MKLTLLMDHLLEVKQVPPCLIVNPRMHFLYVLVKGLVVSWFLDVFIYLIVLIIAGTCFDSKCYCANWTVIRVVSHEDVEGIFVLTGVHLFLKFQIN